MSKRRKIILMYNDEYRPIPVVFGATLPKYYHVLPIEDIAHKRSEKEVLISEPQCYIDSIEDIEKNGIVFHKFNIIIVG